MTAVDPARSLVLLSLVLEDAAENALTAIFGDSEHRVYENGVPQTYVVQEDTPTDRSVILERDSDGARFRVYWSLTVEEIK